MIRIRAERIARGWTQQDLGYHARVSAADISRIEQKRMRPYEAHAHRLAKALDLLPEELLEEVECMDEAQAPITRPG